MLSGLGAGFLVQPGCPVPPQLVPSPFIRILSVTYMINVGVRVM